jgi:bacillithiol system protein YtxJ
MHPDLTPIQGIDELEQALVGSRQRPLLLFKHSYSCGVSAEALDELLLHLAGRRDDTSYAMVTVQTHRDVSNAIVTKLGVRHETPQALLVHDGRVIWSASHFRVNAAALDKAISDAPAPAPRPMPTTTPTES